MKVLLLFWLTTTIYLSTLAAAEFGCLNGNGQRVAWWFIYKEYGTEHYVYLDSTLSQAEPVRVSRRYIPLFNLFLAFSQKDI